jgi:hypothetical protein
MPLTLLGQHSAESHREDMVLRPFHEQDGFAQSSVVAAQGDDGIELEPFSSATDTAFHIGFAGLDLAAAPRTAVPSFQTEAIPAISAKHGLAIVDIEIGVAIHAAWRKEQIAAAFDNMEEVAPQAGNPRHHSMNVTNDPGICQSCRAKFPAIKTFFVFIELPSV